MKEGDHVLTLVDPVRPWKQQRLTRLRHKWLHETQQLWSAPRWPLKQTKMDIFSISFFFCLSV